MILGIFVLTSADAAIKWLVAQYEVIQILFFRNLFALLPILLFMRSHSGLSELRTRRPVVHLLRACLFLTYTLIFFWVLSRLQLADATVLLFTGPLYITILSVPLLGERADLRTWIAVIAGVVGVIVVMRPGTGLFDIAALGAQVAVAGYALLMISNRLLRVTETSAALVFYNAFGALVITTLALPWIWRTPDFRDFVLFSAVGLLSGVGQICLVLAFRNAPAVTVAPIEYTGLLWATVYGFLLWHHFPDRWVLVGAALIALSSGYVMRREALGKKSQFR